MPRSKRRKHWKRFLWTRSMIISGIKVLKRNKIPLNSAALQRNKAPQVSEILSNALGISVTGAKLFHGAIGYYGSWDEALRKAGLDPTLIRRHDEFWTEELILSGIRALHSAGISLHVNGVVKEKSREALGVLKSAVGKDIRGLHLHSAGIRLFGSWSRALEAAGLDPEFIRRDHSFWTKEIIVRSIQALYTEHVPIHIYRLSRDRSQKTTDILRAIVHRRVTGSALYVAAIKKFRAWDIVLKAAGIEPREVRNDTKFWTKQKIKTAVRALHRAGVPLCVAKIEKDRSSENREIIYRSSGIRASSRKLYRTSVRKFGSWDNVLKAADLDPIEIRRTTRCLSKEGIIRAIRKLEKNRTPLNHAKLKTLSNRKISKNLNLGKIRSKFGIKLYTDAKKQFGSWDNALIAAGLNPKEIRRDKGFWTKELIVDSVLALKRARVPLNCVSMQFNKDPEISEIISSVTGRRTTGASLYCAVVARYGSWTKSVRAVKRNPELLGGNSRYLSSWLVQKSIRKLHNSGISLNSASVQKERSVKARQILRSVTEGPATPISIYRAARKHFKTWDEALAKSSLDPSRIRRAGMPVSKSGLPINEVISAIQSNGFAMNSKSIFQNSSAIRLATYCKLRKVLSGKSTWSAAKREHGDWETALRMAGFDPIDIVLRSTKKWSLSTLAHQFERIATEDGGVRRVAYLGAPPKAPDQIHEENLLADGLDQAVHAMVDEDQELTSQIFDFILSQQSFSNQADLIESIANSLGGKATSGRVREILQRLAESPQLKVFA
jgi:hypothetical protein